MELSPSGRSHAIVIGGSIAGLLAARVLINYFELVTIIERDHYPCTPAFRPGVPQGRHIHILLLRGQKVIESLFPGIREKLLSHGARECDYGDEIYYYGGRCPQLPRLPQFQGWSCSRELLEWQMREELQPYEQIRVLEEHEVTGLLVEAQCVCGIQFRERRSDQHTEIQELRGDLIVDASGRSSKASQWLEQLKYTKETLYPTGIGYATRTFDAPKHPLVAMQSTQPPKHTGVLMSVEKGMMVGVAANTPPDETAFRDFIRNLPDQTIWRAMKDAKPLSKMYGYRHTENHWRHFERLRRWPEGFIIIGDALCTFNPIYGQGMTVAALEVELLETLLHTWKGQGGLAHRFQKKVAQILTLPWTLATATEKKNGQVAQKYLDRLITLLPNDDKVWLTFLEVIHMIRPPLALFHPFILMKVITGKRK